LDVFGVTVLLNLWRNIFSISIRVAIVSIASYVFSDFAIASYLNRANFFGSATGGFFLRFSGSVSDVASADAFLFFRNASAGEPFLIFRNL
jgi:hypothetical protein